MRKIFKHLLITLILFSTCQTQNNSWQNKKDFSVDFQRSSEYMLVNELHLQKQTLVARKSYLNHLITKYKHSSVKLKVIKKVYSSTSKVSYFEFKVEKIESSFARGVLPVKMTPLTPFDNLNIGLAVRDIDPSTATQNGSVVVSGRRVLQSEDNYKRVRLPPIWVMSFDISSIFEVVGIVLRVIILCIQFFLVAVRPFVSPKNSIMFFWGASVTSTLFSLQILICMGAISENFGGYIDKSLTRMFSHSNEFYLNYFNSSYIDSFKVSESAGFFNMERANYSASPLFENYLSLIILTISLILCYSLPKGAISHWAREVRFGSTVSYMVPLIISGANCAYSVFFGGIYTGGSMFSLIISIIVYIYYAFFFIETPIENNRFFFGRYDHLQFDCPHFLMLRKGGYIEFYASAIITLVYGFGGFFYFYPLAICCIVSTVQALATLQLSTVGEGFYPQEDYSYFFRLVMLKKIQCWTRPVIFFLLSFYSCLEYFELEKLIITIGLTILFFVLVAIDLWLNFAILIARCIALTQPNMYSRTHFLAFENGRYDVDVMEWKTMAHGGGKYTQVAENQQLVGKY